MARAASEERFIFEEITSALRRHGLDYDSPVRQVLNLGARVAGDHEFSVLALDNRGELVTLDHRLEELKADPRYAELFPNPPRVPRNDMAKMKENFEQITRGDVIAESRGNPNLAAYTGRLFLLWRCSLSSFFRRQRARRSWRS